jgi:hypothetical protein
MYIFLAHIQEGTNYVTYWHADPRIFKAEAILFFGKTIEWVWKKYLRQVNDLKSQGYTVIRFWKKETRENVDDCIQIILQAIKQHQTE